MEKDNPKTADEVEEMLSVLAEFADFLRKKGSVKKKSTSSLSGLEQKSPEDAVEAS